LYSHETLQGNGKLPKQYHLVLDAKDITLEEHEASPRERCILLVHVSQSVIIENAFGGLVQ
jgi:hypothetical protein